MVLYVRELDPAEHNRLQAWGDAEDSELAHRAKVILLSAQGYRIPEIGQILDAHPANLRKWIHRFNESGCHGLRTVRAGGAKPRLSSDQKEEIVALAQKPPRELGLSYTSWTLHKLAEEAQQRAIVESISHEYVRQILKAAECSYKHAIA